MASLLSEEIRLAEPALLAGVAFLLLLVERLLLVEVVLLVDVERVLLVIAKAFSTLAPKPEKQLEVKGRMRARMREERARWRKMTTTTKRALEERLSWSVLATSCSFNQASWFAKKVLLEEHSGSGLELRLQWRRWMRELVKSWRRCKMSQMPFEPPRLRSQVIKASHQSMRASQITST